mgnify:CR=1 FL=1
MTKLLEKALEAVRRLPPDSQDRIALAMLSLSGNEGEAEEIDPAHLPKVLEGLYGLVSRLYGLTVTVRDDVAVWHPDARYLELADADGQVIGGLYTDYYARDGKRAGAWMGEITNRQNVAGEIRRPVANVVCNFAPPDKDQPALLRHSDVVTLFHEIGRAHV